MKAKVSTLYRDGHRLAGSKVARTVIGDLNLSVNKHPVTLRCDHEASVLSETGSILLPCMHNVSCTCIAAEGMTLLGVEIIASKEVAQEWWCTFLLPSDFAVLSNLVTAYEREVDPAHDWRQTALTEDEFSAATKEYRAAKEWLSANEKAER